MTGTEFVAYILAPTFDFIFAVCLGLYHWENRKLDRHIESLNQSLKKAGIRYDKIVEMYEAELSLYRKLVSTQANLYKPEDVVVLTPENCTLRSKT